jgi:hypothetical protein
MLESILSVATTVLLYLMLGVPFTVWSGRTALASAMAQNDGRPSRAAGIWLVVLPALLIVYYVVSGAFPRPVEYDIAGVPVPDEWRQLTFLAIPPAAGMIAGYFLGARFARNRKR